MKHLRKLVMAGRPSDLAPVLEEIRQNQGMHLCFALERAKILATSQYEALSQEEATHPCRWPALRLVFWCYKEISGDLAKFFTRTKDTFVSYCVISATVVS